MTSTVYYPTVNNPKINSCLLVYFMFFVVFCVKNCNNNNVKFINYMKIEATSYHSETKGLF